MAVLSQFGIPGGGSGVHHPKLSHKWRVTFTNMARLVPGTNVRDLTMQAVNVDRPTLEFDEVQIHRYNSTAYVAGKSRFSPISMGIEDDISGLATKVVKGQLETQQRLVGIDLDGRWMNSAATGSDYKFGLKLEMLDGDELVVEHWYLEGCWIVNAEFGSLDYSNSEAVKINLSIRFDHARSDDAEGAGAGLGSALGGNIN